MEISDLPAVNATLNGLAAIFLTTGHGVTASNPATQTNFVL